MNIKQINFFLQHFMALLITITDNLKSTDYLSKKKKPDDNQNHRFIESLFNIFV